MMKKTIISFVLLLIYSVILAHNLLPHHHHSHGSTNHHHFSLTNPVCKNNCDHSNSSDSQECNFPFHLHSVDHSGEFFNINTQINFSSLVIATVVILLNSDFEEELEKNTVPDFIPYIYKGPDISSFSLRGPPLT
jgi:hypothetical protein